MLMRSNRVRAGLPATVVLVLMTLVACGVTLVAQSRARAGDAVPDLTILDLSLVAAGTEDLAGRPVYLRNVRVLRLADTHGFFLDAQAGAVYVLPERATPAMVAPGDVITLQGVIANVPRLVPGEINPPSGWNRHIYVMATKITR